MIFILQRNIYNFPVFSCFAVEGHVCSKHYRVWNALFAGGAAGAMLRSDVTGGVSTSPRKMINTILKHTDG